MSCHIFSWHDIGSTEDKRNFWRQIRNPNQNSKGWGLQSTKRELFAELLVILGSIFHSYFDVRFDWYLQFEGTMTLSLWGVVSFPATLFHAWRLNVVLLTFAGNGFVPILLTRGWWEPSLRPGRRQEDCNEVKMQWNEKIRSDDKRYATVSQCSWIAPRRM